MKNEKIVFESATTHGPSHRFRKTLCSTRSHNSVFRLENPFGKFYQVVFCFPKSSFCGFITLLRYFISFPFFHIPSLNKFKWWWVNSFDKIHVPFSARNSLTLERRWCSISSVVSIHQLGRWITWTNYFQSREINRVRIKREDKRFSPTLCRVHPLEWMTIGRNVVIDLNISDAFVLYEIFLSYLLQWQISPEEDERFWSKCEKITAVHFNPLFSVCSCSHLIDRSTFLQHTVSVDYFMFTMMDRWKEKNVRLAESHLWILVILLYCLIYYSKDPSYKWRCDDERISLVSYTHHTIQLVRKRMTQVKDIWSK